MKKLELNDYQITKLKEMYKKLFPSYNIGMCDENQNILYCKISENGSTSDKPFIVDTIYWFEFCLTHLYNEIKRYGVSETLTYTNLMSAGNHPIDYLYKEFKKLKL